MSSARATQTERTRLAWSRSVLSLLGLALLEARVLAAVDVVTALVLIAATVAAAAAALVLIARRHPRVRPGGRLRRDLGGGLPALVAALAGLIGVGLLVLVLG